MLKRSRRGEKNIQKNCIKKDLNELDYWDGVVHHPEPDTLECEVKWAFLRSTAVNKVSGCDEIPAELFKFLKEEANKVLHSLCLHIRKTEQWPQDWKRLILIPIPKKGSTKECANHQLYWSPMLVRSYLKSFARLQHYVNQELPDVQAEFTKERETRDQIVNICWIIEKAREFQENMYLCFIDYMKAFDCVDHDKLWKALTEMGIPELLTCLLRSLHMGQEATIRTMYGTTDWCRIEKEVQQGYLLSLCLTYTLSTSWEMPGLDEFQAGIKRSRRNINNLRYVNCA